MIKDLIKIKHKVAQVLAQHGATRDNDKLLWLGTMVMFYDLKNVLGEDGYNKFKHWLLNNDVPTFESVTRIRRKYQEAGSYLGKNRAERMDEEKAVREWARD